VALCGVIFAVRKKMLMLKRVLNRVGLSVVVQQCLLIVPKSANGWLWKREYILHNMPVNALDNLLVVQEHEGSIAFIWCVSIPSDYKEGKDIDVPDGDVWTICSSVLKRL